MRLTWIAAACIMVILFISSTHAMKRVMHAAAATDIVVTVTAQTLQLDPSVVPSGDVVLVVTNQGPNAYAVSVTDPVRDDGSPIEYARCHVGPGETTLLRLPAMAPGAYRVACQDNAEVTLIRDGMLRVTVM